MLDAKPQITSLTPEQKLALAQYSQRWSSPAWFTAKLDHIDVDLAVYKLYEILGLQEPQILWCQSPFQLIAMPLLMRAVLASDLSEHDRWMIFNRAKTAERKKHARDPMVQLWANFNAQLDRMPMSQVPKELGKAVSEKVTTYLYHQTIPAVVAAHYQAFSTSVQKEIDLSLHERPRRQFIDFWRNIDFIPPVSVAWMSFLGGLDRYIKDKVSLLMLKDHEELLGVDANSSMLINTDHSVRTWLHKHHGYWWGPQDLYWLAKHEFERKEIGAHIFDDETNTALDMWLTLANGGAAFLFMENYCFICERPTIYELDEERRLHNPQGPAFAFSDHESIYSWHGVNMPSRVIEDRSTLDAKRIEGEGNLEVRRAMLEMFGIDRFLKESGARKVQQDKFGILYRKEMRNDEPLVMVEVLNSTPEPDGQIRHYFLRVPPGMRTAREAVAWTFGLLSDEYTPDLET